MYQWIPINKPEDIAELAKHLPQVFDPAQVVKHLTSALSSKVKAILIEHRYTDKDYRSTYYGFYAKKGLRYDPFCTRLHFFAEGVSLSQDLELRWTLSELREHYFGYMVLRPTEITPIGRTVLSVAATKDFSGWLIEADHVVHVLGHRIVVRGFPYMQQHTDISVCAHAACWGILRHYSARYRRYAEFLVHDITRMACEADPGGLLPSRGLAVDQAGRVFASAGLFPDIYDRDQFDTESFYRLLAAYVESGFPVFAAMTAPSKEHAVTVIGHGHPDRQALKPGQGLQYAWDATMSLIAIDDNLMPYRRIDELDTVPHKLHDIDIFIVPLPEKIFFPAEAVEKHMSDMLGKGFMNLDLSHLKDPVMRYFVTTSASFKHYVQRNRTQYPTHFFTALSELVLPQFVWVVELASLTDWQAGRCNSMMILDATASANDAMPFFVAHDRKRAFIYDRGVERSKGWITFDRDLNHLSELRSNLTPMY